MIQKLQKFFHTDKWWGKTIFIVLTYVFYWCIFYGSTLLIPYSSYNTDFDTILPFIYIFILVPIISFFIPFLIRKIINQIELIMLTLSY